MIKEIVIHAHNPSHPHRDEFSSALDAMETEADLADSVYEQLKACVSEQVPTAETRGPHFSQAQCQRSWAHFNLREQAELLQIQLLLLHHKRTGKADSGETFKKLCQLFQDHAFGQRQNSERLLSEVDPDLVASIGLLESIILVYLLDLPSLTLDPTDHPIFSKEETTSSLDKLILGLGSQADHGPVMLAWTLAQFLTGGEAALPRYKALGERAVQLRALHTLSRAVESPVLGGGSSKSNASVRGVTRGVCYALLSVLSSSFDPRRMGMAEDAHMLACRTLEAEAAVAADFWKQVP